MSKPLEVRTHVTAAELAQARRTTQQRGVRRDWLFTTRTLGDAEVKEEDLPTYMAPAERPGVKKEARTVRDNIIDRRMSTMQRFAEKNPAAWKDLIEKLRQMYPGLANSMTDDEIYRTVMRHKVEESTERVFKKMGRGASKV